MSDVPYIEVVGWADFQHYKDRDPPWIKLHRKLLDNYEWACLQDASKALLVGIWLLAARHHNRVPADPKWIQERVGVREPVNLQPLVDAGFIRASAPLAPCKQSATLERETETEGETAYYDDGGEAPKLPAEVQAALAPYVRSARFPRAIEARVALLLNPEARPHYAAAEIVRALGEMQSKNRDFDPNTLATWCANLRKRREDIVTETDELGVMCRWRVEPDGSKTKLGAAA